MALSNLTGWNEKEVAAACGTACGASDKPEEKPAACGSVCFAGDIFKSIRYYRFLYRFLYRERGNKMK